MNDLELAAQIKEGGLKALQSALKYKMALVHSLLRNSYYYIDDKGLKWIGEKRDYLKWRVSGIYLKGVCVWFQDSGACGLLWSTDPRAKYERFCHPAPHAVSENGVLRDIKDAPQAIHGKIDSVLKDIFKIIEEAILRCDRANEENEQALIKNWERVVEETKPTCTFNRYRLDIGETLKEGQGWIKE
jgi:hypothetical protein